MMIMMMVITVVLMVIVKLTAHNYNAMVKEKMIITVVVMVSRSHLLTVAGADHGHPHHIHRVLKVFQSPNDAAERNNKLSEN